MTTTTDPSMTATTMIDTSLASAAATMIVAKFNELDDRQKVLEKRI
jgi:hypothetical protein